MQHITALMGSLLILGLGVPSVSLADTLPDAHAPAGVMFDHMHKDGELMIGYRYMYGLQDGGMRAGTRSASDAELAAAGFSSTPDKMQMHMHMLDIMYAPRSWLTLMVMPQLTSMEMQMRPVAGVMGGHGGHGGASGAHAHGTEGVGDTAFAALISVHESNHHHVHAGLAFSAPTGSVEEKGSDGRFTHYMMQLGSGTWDALPSITYTGRSGPLSWGAQIGATLRLESENESGFRFGDQGFVTAWTAYRLTDWLSASARVAYSEQGRIKGHYNGPHNHASPPDLQANHGGRFVDLGLGLNASVQGGAFKGIRLGVEWLEPLEDDPHGFQQERGGALFATASRAF